MMQEFYKRIRKAKTFDELKEVYNDFARAFVNDEISIEQYNSLRMAFHNAKILRITE